MEIVLYVPTHDKAYIEKLAKSLCLVNGGLTIINDCLGLWIEKGKEFKDDITLIQILINDNEINLHIKLKAFRVIALKMKHELNQISVLYTINKNTVFI
jgi:hypothetical protein